MTEDPTPETPSSETDSPRPRVARLLEQLGAGLYERDEAVRLALLASVAGESIFLLGPPGVGKSLVARRLKHAFASGRAFEYLMSRFSTPDEIFGPVSIRKLREEDRYERRIEGYLPGSDVIFLDEIWKAGPAIQNALLTVLNERIYRNGDRDVQVAVRAILAASNELPPEGDTLSPLWDRFLLRYEMTGVKGVSGFLSMITDTQDVYADNVDADIKLDAALLDAWSAPIDAVALPPEVLNVIQVVRQRIEEGNESGGIPSGPLELYDRRWKKIVRLLRTAAFLNGRDQVDLMDCALMVHALWSAPEQRTFLTDVVHDAVAKHGYSLATGLAAVRSELDEVEADIRSETEFVHVVSETRPLLVDGAFHTLVNTNRSFTGTRISAADFARLSVDEPVAITYGDGSGENRIRVRTWLSTRPHCIDVEVRGTRVEVPLETGVKEREERVSRDAHPLLVEHWGRRLDRLEQEIQTCLARLEDAETGPLAGLEDNLFVEPAFARVVRRNHDRVVAGFRSLALRCEKARFRAGGKA